MGRESEMPHRFHLHTKTTTSAAMPDRNPPRAMGDTRCSGHMQIKSKCLAGKREPPKTMHTRRHHAVRSRRWVRGWRRAAHPRDASGRRCVCVCVLVCLQCGVEGSFTLAALLHCYLRLHACLRSSGQVEIRRTSPYTMTTLARDIIQEA